MLSVLIIDDEPNVRKGLKIIVPWRENGFEICGEAGDSEEGLKKILSLRPNIVLIDIKMSGKLGTEVIKEAIQNGFKGKFIIISGYSNFEYAKDAIKYGVKSYILKPIDEDELLDEMLKLGKEIKEQQAWKANIEIIKEAKLRKLILGQCTDIENTYEKYSDFKLALIFSNLYGENGINMVKIEEIIKNEYEKWFESTDITMINNYAAILLKDFSYSHAEKELFQLREKLNKDVFITIGEEVYSANLVNQSYKSAEEIMKNRFLYLEKGVVSYKNIRKEYTEKNDIQNIDYEKIYNYVEVKDKEELKKIIRSIEIYMRKSKYSEKEIKIIGVKLFLELREKIINDYDLKESDLKSKEEIMTEIHSKESLKGISDYLIDNFTKISEIIGNQSSKNIVMRVVNYINKNYYRDLKLESLAELFNYNSAYLGKLFKNEVGESFNTYLDKIRIEKAKQMLIEKKFKVYKVCEKVGYKNLDYFHSKFKKYVGISPLNYKKQNYERRNDVNLGLWGDDDER